MDHIIAEYRGYLPRVPQNMEHRQTGRTGRAVYYRKRSIEMLNVWLYNISITISTLESEVKHHEI